MNEIARRGSAQTVTETPRLEGTTITELQRVETSTGVVVVVAQVERSTSEKIRIALWLTHSDGTGGSWRWLDLHHSSVLAILDTLGNEARAQLVRRKKAGRNRAQAVVESEDQRFARERRFRAARLGR